MKAIIRENKLYSWRTMLQEIIKEYPCHTTENVLSQIEARLKAMEQS